MIFENLWPLFFLAAVPVIIILYLLKPKGTDYLISSNLLWKKFLKNEQSQTFWEKFVKNILMYLQILIIVLLVVALMSPFWQKEGQGGGRKILVLDRSGSMQHVDDAGKSRFEEAVAWLSEDIQNDANTRFSLVTVDGGGASLLAVDSTDVSALLKMVKGIGCSDSTASAADVQSVIDTLTGSSTEEAQIIVYTDGAGASDFETLFCTGGKTLRVAGKPGDNVANEYMVFSKGEDGLYNVMVSLTNYSGQQVSLDVGLYDEENRLMDLSQITLLPEETQTCLFDKVEWRGESMSSKISGIRFEEGNGDSLTADNVSYAVKTKGNLIQGILVGEGNIFLEKAYQAVTGTAIVRAESIQEAEEDVNVVIYDVGEEPLDTVYNSLMFGNVRNSSVQVLENVVLDMTDCDLTTGLSGFTIGVNRAYCFRVPEGAVSFLEYDGKCVGYYGEQNGIREVVLGFDIRETDFPLRAEFPVFLANAMIYLSDTSWLASNVYYAGEKLALQPWAEADNYTERPLEAGLYNIGNEEYTESYVVRFPVSESDGRAESSVTEGEDVYQLQKVKQTLRNVFILLAIVLLVVEWIVYVRQLRYRGKFYLILRGIVLGSVILALLGIEIPLGSSHICTIFVVDMSDSNEEHLEEMSDYLRETIKTMPSGNSYGIVSFGSNTLVEQFLTANRQYGGLMTIPEKTATNFEEALSKALTMIPGGAKGRIVVLTDGKETRGDISHMANALLSSKAEFLTLVYEDTVMPDAYVENVTLPSYLYPGDKYTVRVQVESNFDTDGVIRLYDGSELVAENSVHLNNGSNRFAFSRQVPEDYGANHAMETLRAVLEVSGDTCQENNTYSAYSVVEAVPKMLVISGRKASSQAFVPVLKAAGCDYSVVSVGNAPSDIYSMLEYKTILLNDVYAEDLPGGFLDNLEAYVKDYGCGLICCGGEDSFALGGYKDTVLETVLPVNMQMRNINEMPSMAMVMVIDRSGSMGMNAENSVGATNLDLAIKAATVAVDNLKDSDFVGILTFDDAYSWQVELTKAEDRSTIKEAVTTIRDGGGTTIKPALQEAYEALMGSEASIRHVVLLTDGMGETSDFEDIMAAYSGAGITLSTVAVGKDADTSLLEKLAEGCGGRYYYSDMATEIPKIFAQEVFLGGDSYIQDGTFALSVQGGHELTTGLFADGWPDVYGYISASPKMTASCVITAAEKEDPILTVWQYGLGRTVAWNSDVTGAWSGAFAGKEDYVGLWKRIVDYTAGNTGLGEDRADVVVAGDTITLSYKTEKYDAHTEICATVISPKGQTEEMTLYAVEPGKYEAELPASQTGLYHFHIRRMQDGEMQSYITTAAAVQFSYEYKYDVSTDAYIRFASQYGRIVTPEDEIWNPLHVRVGEKRALTNFLLGFAIILFLADVAARRFQYEPVWRGISRQKGETEDVESNGKQQKPEEAGKSKKKNKAKKSPQKSGEQTLDTSQLLNKKENRNI